MMYHSFVLMHFIYFVSNILYETDKGQPDSDHTSAACGVQTHNTAHYKDRFNPCICSSNHLKSLSNRL